MKTIPPPPDRVPMHQVEALAEWLVPGRGLGLLTNAINCGELHAFALCAPPQTGMTITETHDDGTEAAPEWIDRWTDGPLAPAQVAWARCGANFPHSGWERWFDHLVKVDQYELATLIDRVAAMVPIASDGVRWTANKVFDWIAKNCPTSVNYPSAPAPDFDATAWQFACKAIPWRALIWRIERGAGDWRGLPGNDAPAARKIFDALHGALFPQIDELKVYIERADGWHDAPAAVFAGAMFDTTATALDLASGARLVFDAESVQRLWPTDGQDRPPQNHQRFTDAERRAWIAEQRSMAADAGHKLFKAHPQFDGTKQDTFRREWGKIRGTKRGAPRKS